MYTQDKQHRAILQRIAHRVMLERGLAPDFSDDVIQEVDRIHAAAPAEGKLVKDYSDLLWCSIDNDDSRDLDQLSVAQELSDGKVKLMVAVADVDALVPLGCAIDEHARQNTTSVYTAGEMFPMLPEKLSTNLTSLNPYEYRLANVVEMVVNKEGMVEESYIHRAKVYNHAKLAYNAVSDWLEGEGPIPPAMASVPGLDENIRIQDAIAQRMRRLRHLRGALSLQTIKAKPVYDGDQLRDLSAETQNRAQKIIEDLMIAANGVVARYLEKAGFPSIRRIVRTPKRWERIVELAAQYKYRLPGSPDSRALQDFLVEQRENDPVRFPDLSLSVIKLLGSGEYVAEIPGETVPGHFGLAVRDYAHSTAPNRRYPDLITQRLLKAALASEGIPYGGDELEDLARHCTEAEDAVNKVERQVDKSAAALLLEDRIGEEFEGIVTGASPKGTWCRLFRPPVEGRVVAGYQGADVGDRIRVELVEVDVEQGFIDFRRV